MKSITELFTIGYGPSSSHTIGPIRAAKQFAEKHPNAHSFRVVLYASLAATGKGHFTDQAIINTLKPKPVDIVWRPEQTLPEHPNAMEFQLLSEDAQTLDSWFVYSVGGGTIKEEGQEIKTPDIYPLSKIVDIRNWCLENNKTYSDYVDHYEDAGFWDYIGEVWQVMKESLLTGLNTEGVLAGGLGLKRKSRSFFLQSKRNSPVFQRTGLLSAYALAVSEENAAGGKVVTAPTCGSAGVLPAVLKYLQDFFDFTNSEIYRALATAGLFGNVVKHNASISGAEVGCQGEIGSACAMTSAAACELMQGDLFQIGYAAEMGIEHHLGLTCDPIAGLVQIPCIERNAYAATRALDCADYALLSDGRHRITFDNIVQVMKQTGLDLKSAYRETSTGGLALI